jgi:TP901 family phage tail tape measure protein
MADSGYTYLIQIDSNGNVVLPALQRHARETDRALSALGLHAREGFVMFGREAGRASSMLQGLRSTALSLGAGMGLAAMGKSIVQTGLTFEKEMSNVGAISNATADELTLLTQAARQAGATTVFSATQSAQAMSFLAQAGYRADEQISALKGTLNMAAAANMDLAQAADVTVSILSQYQMQAKQAGAVSDQLAYTANAFNTNVGEIAEAMKYMGPTAHAFGVSLAETNAVIGLLSNGGLKGSMATRALGTGISRLAAPTAMMRKAMSELGLQVFDASGKFIGMAEMLKQLETALAGMSDRQKQGYLSKIFSAESLQEMNILLAAGGDAVEDWTDKIDASMGEAERVAKEKLDNLAGDAKLFTSVMEEQSLSLYDKMQPALRSLVQEATAFITAMDTTALASSLGGFAQGLMQTGMTLMKITGFAMKHWQALMAMAKIYVSIKAFMLTYNATVRATIALQRAWTVATQLYTSVTRTATAATAALNTAMRISPWGMLAGLIGAAASAMALFRDHTAGATEAQEKLSAARFEAEHTWKESQGLREGTDVDALALQNGTLNESQKQVIAQNAQMRISQLERMQAEYIAYNKQVEEKRREMDAALAEARVKPDVGKKVESAKDVLLYFNKSYWDKKEHDRKYEEYNALVGASQAIQWKMPFSDREISELIAKNKPMLLPERAALPQKTAPLPTAAEAAGNISRGGASQKIINITVHKFQDDINIHVNAGDHRGEVAARNISEQVKEELMRVLNSANAIAG